jgi:hypothetical protein
MHACIHDHTASRAYDISMRPLADVAKAVGFTDSMSGITIAGAKPGRGPSSRLVRAQTIAAKSAAASAKFRSPRCR